jgi:Uma2 family endonuclease
MSQPSEIAERRAVYDPVPPLENGDRLTRAEFERRYRAMPRLKKAELIEGVVYMPSPVRLRSHGLPHCDLIAWLGTYKARTPGLLTGDNSTVRLDLDNEPQPDVLLLVDPARGGQAAIDDDDYVAGAPELVAEVASSSASYDLGVKKNAFRRNGVREYVVWRVLDLEIDWFVLREGRYEELSPDASGIYRSEVFPGLWLDAAAMVRGDLARVLDTLQEGLASPEHAALVERLGGAGPG